MAGQTLRGEIHDYDRQLESALRRIRGNTRWPAHNRKQILSFYESLQAEGLSKPRVIYYLNRLSRIADWLDASFDRATKLDIEIVMRHINGTDYAEWTEKDFKGTLKKFYRWLRGCSD